MAQNGPPAVQDPAPVADQARNLLLELAATYPGTPEITVEAPRISQQAACDQLEAFLPGAQGLRSRTSVGVRCLAPQAWTLYVQASVQIMGEYFVANRAINRGETLSLDDLDFRTGDLLRNHRLIGDPSHIVGWVTTRRIPKGSAIQGTALRDPQSIERGNMVRTIARGIGFVASGEGQALESGAPGSQIQVRTTSGQIITGTVIDGHTVQVMM
ncbi:MAG TPA: flagellar basal body P-ring formation chaperone FlgA [Castellaniella sp.]|nr:flagellar basal body P-ring formation chaperone FlgA [Castellaniella sp.]